MKKKLKWIKLSLELLALKLFSLTPWLSGVYYLFLSTAFNREHQGVIKGKIKYYRNLKKVEGARFLLSRNVHRLEKGLIMKNRREVFGLEYITETIDAYVVVAQNEKLLSRKLLKWYTDVLNLYFNSVSKSNNIISFAENKFNKFKIKEIEPYSHTASPYKRDFNLLKVEYEDILDLSRLRRSVRWYEDKSVPREMIDKAIKVASLSPSACNRQPFKFLIYDDESLIKEISNITWGTSGFNHNFKVFVVIVGMLEAYFDERDRHVIYIDSSLAAMSFMYALESLGLSSCPINWPDVKEFERKIRKIIGLKENERPIMLMSLGYPDKDALVPFSEKKEVSELREYNFINN